jgi:hypothetical protein
MFIEVGICAAGIHFFLPVVNPVEIASLLVTQFILHSLCFYPHFVTAIFLFLESILLEDRVSPQQIFFFIRHGHKLSFSAKTQLKSAKKE